MKVYHYTSLDNWALIKKGSWKSRDKSGLGAIRRVGQVHEDALDTGAVFALLEPVPKNWTHNTQFPDIWFHLTRDIGRMLLEIQVDESDKNVFVVDRGEIEKFLYKIGSEGGGKEIYNERKIAEGKYIGSKVPIAEYLRHPERYPFVLPEVIFTDDIPIEKISISAEQPLMQELLDKEVGETGSYRDSVIRQIKEIPELKAWYETKYLGKKNESPSSEIGGKLR
ncbi:MAG: hypothetical protein WC735_01815 [Candidatus Paceibacterota bacterium]|jgi:hypothetical protein